MKSAELDKLIQKVTDQVLVELNANNKLVIDSNNEWELYPTWFQKMVSADFRCQSNAKQDSNAILLCLSKLSLNDMLAISNLVAINDRCEKVLDYVIKGLPVWIIGKEEDYLKQKKNQRYAVYKRIEYALEEIKKYGITLISNKQELKENILIIKKQNEKRIPKRFITLREVQERSNKGIKLLKDFEVPTDLAKEWIAKRGDNHEH